MPSPFPGMDPWLEWPGIFPDLHGALITYIGDALNAVLPDEYVARASTRIWVEPRQIREPDVSLFGPPRPPRKRGGGAVATAMRSAGLIEMRLPASDPMKQPFLEVRSTAGDRLVTAVEVLSPANKAPGEGRRTYLAKQEEYLTTGVGLVEIDLLRGGEHATAAPLGRMRALGDLSYHYCISPSAAPGRCYVAPIRLGDPLPAATVPLDAGVDPVSVELRPLLDRAYDGRRYARSARYAEPPDPPLTADQAAWAADILRSKGVL